MNKQEREALMDKLQRDMDATAIDMAFRKQAREDAGDYDPPVILKQARASTFNPADAIADQEFQKQRNYKPRSKPTRTSRDGGELVTLDVLQEALCTAGDEIFKLLGSDFKKLRNEIAALRDEIEVLKSANVTQIGRSRNAKAS